MHEDAAARGRVLSAVATVVNYVHSKVFLTQFFTLATHGDSPFVCDVSCDVIYYVIAVRARRMVRIFLLPYLGNRSKSDPCPYELFCLESHILSFPKVLQIPPESPCISLSQYEPH